MKTRIFKDLYDFRTQAHAIAFVNHLAIVGIKAVRECGYKVVIVSNVIDSIEKQYVADAAYNFNGR